MEKINELKFRLWNSILFLIIFGLLVIGCKSQNKSKDDLVTIDLGKIILNEREVPISEFVDQLEYIPLEITPESGINNIRKIYLTDEYLIIRHDSRGSNNLLLLFDRISGKYIREIGKRGRGPEEYSLPLDCFYNTFDNRIYAYGSNRASILSYNFDGSYSGSFITPLINETSINKNLSIDAFYDPAIFVGYLNNSTGRLNKRIVLFSKDSILLFFPNYEKWESSEITINQDPIFFSWRNKISFKERSNDTIFYVTMESLIPRLVLNSEEARYPKKLSREEAMEQMTKPQDYYETQTILESSKYLFFDLASKNKPIENDPSAFKLIRNLCIFDKLTNEVYVCNNNYETTNSTLKDDINNFIPFMPISITKNDELVSVIQASEIIKWKNGNPDQSAELCKKMPWLEKIKELDNPVIVIGIIKK